MESLEDIVRRYVAAEGRDGSAALEAKQAMRAWVARQGLAGVSFLGRRVGLVPGHSEAGVLEDEPSRGAPFIGPSTLPDGPGRRA